MIVFHNDSDHYKQYLAGFLARIMLFTRREMESYICQSVISAQLYIMLAINQSYTNG
jgi:hypothetical protein